MFNSICQKNMWCVGLDLIGMRKMKIRFRHDIVASTQNKESIIHSQVVRFSKNCLLTIMISNQKQRYI